MGSGFASRSDGVPDLVPRPDPRTSRDAGPYLDAAPSVLRTQYSVLPHHPPLPHFAFSKGFSMGTITGAMTDFQTA